MRQVRLGALLALLVGALLWPAAPGARAAGEAGFIDFSFFVAARGQPNVDAVTTPSAEKPQSKLWYNDGRWWADLVSPAARAHRIFALDRATQQWIDTGTRLDPRLQTKSDCLWDGAHLYVVSGGGLESTGADLDAQLFRYSYANGAYRLDSGFPVTVRRGGAEAIVIDKDTRGTLWVAYTQGNTVFVNSSAGADNKWGSPLALAPAQTNGTVTTDDIASLVAYGGKIGVLWSNQNDGGFYFASHADGTPANRWSGTTVARSPGLADDHISLKALQSDATGTLYAAVKTSLTQPGEPSILLLVGRPQASGDVAWATVLVSAVSANQTRPMVMLDSTNRQVYVILADESGGSIYYKSASLDAPAFDPNSKGQLLIGSARAPFLNNATSSKQSVNGATDLVALASYDNFARPSASPATTDVYAHGVIDLAGGAPPSSWVFVPLARR